MSCHTTTDLLPWFLNGSLAEDEKALVQQHLVGCAECRADLAATRQAAAIFAAHLPPAALIAHLLGETVPGLSPATIATHLASCESCREELELLRQGQPADEAPTATVVPFRPLMTPAVEAAGATGRTLGDRWGAGRWQRLALAAGVAFALVSTGLVWSLLRSDAASASALSARHDLEQRLEQLQQQNREAAGATAAARAEIDRLQGAIREIEEQKALQREQAASAIGVGEQPAKIAGIVLRSLPVLDGVPPGGEVTRGGVGPSATPLPVPCDENGCEAVLYLGSRLASARVTCVLRGANGKELRAGPLAVDPRLEQVVLRFPAASGLSNPIEVEVQPVGQPDAARVFVLEAQPAQAP